MFVQQLTSTKYRESGEGVSPIQSSRGSTSRLKPLSAKKKPGRHARTKNNTDRKNRVMYKMRRVRHRGKEYQVGNLCHAAGRTSWARMSFQYAFAEPPRVAGCRRICLPGYIVTRCSCLVLESGGSIKEGRSSLGHSHLLLPSDHLHNTHNTRVSQRLEDDPHALSALSELVDGLGRSHLLNAGPDPRSHPA